MRDDLERLRDIPDAIESIEKYVSNGLEAYERDELVQVRVVHHIQLIGEAAANVSREIRDRHNSVPWSDVIAMRNVLVHQYFGIDYQEVWDTVLMDLPILKEQIKEILMSCDQEAGT